MATYQKASYFSIGLFTLVGLFLLIGTIIILGSRITYKNAIYVETYFNESVHGLTVGSPVKYRGMEIGKIVDIATINSIYNISPAKISTNNLPIPEKYIYVKIAIDPRLFKGITVDNVEEGIKQEVKNGLRVKISVQGLTGNAYLELDYVKGSADDVLPIKWQPQNYYIPSTTSTLSFFSDNAQYLVEKLKKLELQKTLTAINELTDTTRTTLKHVDKQFESYNQQIREILMNLQVITQNLKMVSGQAKTNPSALLFGSPPPKLDPNKL